MRHKMRVQRHLSIYGRQGYRPVLLHGGNMDVEGTPEGWRRALNLMVSGGFE